MQPIVFRWEYDPPKAGARERHFRDRVRDDHRGPAGNEPHEHARIGRTRRSRSAALESGSRAGSRRSTEDYRRRTAWSVHQLAATREGEPGPPGDPRRRVAGQRPASPTRSSGSPSSPRERDPGKRRRSPRSGRRGRREDHGRDRGGSDPPGARRGEREPPLGGGAPGNRTPDALREAQALRDLVDLAGSGVTWALGPRWGGSAGGGHGPK